MNANANERRVERAGMTSRLRCYARKLILGLSWGASTVLSLGLITAVVLFSSGTATAQLGSLVNADGAFPAAGLALSGNRLYGTAQAGGHWGDGVVFGINADGSGFSTMRSFAGSDGMKPYAELTISNNLLYGTANCGGSTGGGGVFTIKTNGSGFITLYNFDGTGGSPLINSGGADPYSGLVLGGKTLTEQPRKVAPDSPTCTRSPPPAQ